MTTSPLRHRAAGALLAIALVCADGSARAEEGPDLVVLPLANHTGLQAAIDLMLPALYAEFDARGWTVLRHEDVRPVLRRHRIRTLGRIGREDARILARETGARLALIAAVDFYDPSNSLELAMSARLLDLRSMRVAAAVTVGRTPQQMLGLFGRGQIDSIGALVAPVARALCDGLAPVVGDEVPPFTRYHSCGLVALVPLDDYSDRPYGAEIVQNGLLSALVAGGYNVVEPGFVHEILLDHQRVARGGVSDETLSILRTELGTCWVVTGSLEVFFPSPGPDVNSVPRLEVGLRLVDARRARLIATHDRARDGSESEGLFQLGREYSMVDLIRGAMRDVVNWVDADGDDE